MQARISHPRIRNVISCQFVVRDREYLVLALFVGLVAGTPVGWRRRLTAAAFGIPIVQSLLVLALWTQLLDTFAEHAPLPVLGGSPSTRDRLHYAQYLLAQVPLLSHLFALVPWAVLTLRQGDWQKLTALKASDAA